MLSDRAAQNQIRRLLPAFFRRWRRSSHALLSIRESDVFLVSYPRSGNTWARFLLANTLSFGTGVPVDFHSVRNLIPDVEVNDQRALIDDLSSPRVIKSHSSYTADYPRVIYLVRDARDVYVSYYEYLRSQGRFPGAFVDFLNEPDLPAGLWCAHVQSWLDSTTSGKLLMVHYSDMLDDPRRQLERMVDFIGISSSPKQLEYAVEKSAFDEMQSIEDMKGRPYGKPGARFVRQGGTGQWQDYFDEECKQILKARANDLLLQLGYIESKNW